MLAAPASAEPVSEKVSSGVVTAEFTYERDGEDYSDFHLKVVRDGLELVDRAVGPGCPKEPCGVVPSGIAAKQDSVSLRDLDADREPEVIVDLFTGGAHCCAFSTIYTFEEGTGKYARIRHNWRDAGYRIQDVGRDGTISTCLSGCHGVVNRFKGYTVLLCTRDRCALTWPVCKSAFNALPSDRTWPKCTRPRHGSSWKDLRCGRRRCSVTQRRARA